MDATSPNADALERARRVQLVVLDVDGVLTDGRLYIDDNGVEQKAFHVRDGLGIRLLQGQDIEVGVISARTSRAVQLRLESLGVTQLRLGAKRKGETLDEMAVAVGVTLEQCAFVGDDLVDLAAMRKVGLAAAVGDAHPVVQEQAHHVCATPGGQGAVREFAEFVLSAQGKLEAAYAPYLA